jgi:hypothetical protein
MVKAARQRVKRNRAWTRLPKCSTFVECLPMRASPAITSSRVPTGVASFFSLVVSMLPAQEMVRTGLPGQLEHFVAYGGSATIATAGSGLNRGGKRIVGCSWIYSGFLEYLRHFSSGGHPSIEHFGASMLGASSGGLTVALLWRRLANMLHPWPFGTQVEPNSRQGAAATSFRPYRFAPEPLPVSPQYVG